MSKDASKAIAVNTKAYCWTAGDMRVVSDSESAKAIEDALFARLAVVALGYGQMVIALDGDREERADVTAHWVRVADIMHLSCEVTGATVTLTAAPESVTSLSTLGSQPEALVEPD